MKRKIEPVEATVQLTRANCYYMNHGVCSLSVIDDVYVSPVERLPQNDVLYCPRLYRRMCGKEKHRPVPVAPCECGHLQVLERPQRACIAQRRQMALPVKFEQAQPLCAVCGGQTTLQDEEAGKRILSLSVCPVE